MTIRAEKTKETFKEVLDAKVLELIETTLDENSEITIMDRAKLPEIQYRAYLDGLGILLEIDIDKILEESTNG